MSPDTCEFCRRPCHLSPAVACVIVYAHGLPNGYYILEPAEGYLICANDTCDAPRAFVDRAADAHPSVRPYQQAWTRATVIFRDPDTKPWDLRVPRQQVRA